MLRKTKICRMISLFTASAAAVSVISASSYAYDGTVGIDADEVGINAAEVGIKAAGNTGGFVHTVFADAPAGSLDPDELIFPETPTEPFGDAYDADGTPLSSITDYLANDTERAFYLAMKTQCEEFLTNGGDLKKHIEIDGRRLYYLAPIAAESLTPDRASELASLFYYSEPEYYFLSYVSLCWSKEADGFDAIALCVPKEIAKASARAQVKAVIDSTVSKWLPQIEAQVTVLAKELKITELICANIEYDYDVPDVIEAAEYDERDQSIIGAFCDRCCVCAGYSKAAAYLCELAGIEAYSVTSADHQWNLVKLYDNFYELDTTWADIGSGVDPDWVNVSYERMQKLDPDGSHAYEALWETIALPDAVLDDVAIPDAGLVGIRVTTEPAAMRYALNEKFDPTDGIITAYYATSAKGEYTEEIPMTSPEVTISGSTEKTGLAVFTAEYAGMTAELAVLVYDPMYSGVTVSSDKYYAGFNSLSEAFSAIDGQKDAGAGYVISVNKDISEKKLSFPKYAANIGLVSTGGAVITVGSPTLAPKTPVTLGCTIKCGTKPINVSVPKGCTFGVEGGDTAFGTIKGTGTSILSVTSDITAAGISTFASVSADGSITLTGKVSGIGRLDGNVTLSPAASMTVKTLSGAEITLTADTDKNGRLTLPKLTAGEAAGPLTLGVATPDGLYLPSSGTTVMYAANAKTFRGIGNITVNAVNASGRYLSPVAYGKEIRAEYTGALQLTYVSGGRTVKDRFSTFEKLFESLTDADTVYTVTLTEDITATKFTLPKNIGGLELSGGSLTIPGGTLSAKYPLTFRNISVTAVNKKGERAALTIKTTGTLTLSNAVFSGEPVNLYYKQLIAE